MPADERIALALAALMPVLIVLPAVVWFRRRRRDAIFTGVTPGELPALGQQVTRARVGGGRSEWSGPVAVRFTPPDGMTPGLVGTVIDGRADVVDVSATLIDLAVRGYLRLHPEPVDPAAPPPPPAPSPHGRPATAITRPDRDWRLTRVLPAPRGSLLPFESLLLGRVFAQGPQTTIGELKKRGFDLTMREAQIGLYREVVDRGWYTKHPRDRNRRIGCLGLPLLLVSLGLLAYGGSALLTTARENHLLIALGAGLAMASVLLFIGMRGRTPRSAEGSAARIQALGFKDYLTKAEAGQIRFEEAADLFSRYLPYAMVFGVADRWAQTFADVAARAHLAGVGDPYFDFTWIDGGDMLWNLGTGVGDLLDATDLIGDGLSGVADAAGDFASAASGLLDFGDGCGGCDALDGCDLF